MPTTPTLLAASIGAGPRPLGRTSRRLARFLVLVFLGATVGAKASLGAVPHDMSYQGTLTDAVGAPLAGPVDLNFRIFDVLSGGSALYEEEHLGVSLDDQGGFSVLLGQGTPLTGTFNPALFAGINRYLEVTVDAETLAPRQPLSSVPWALISEEANTVQGQDVVAQLGTVATDVSAAQSSADSADAAASEAQATADANAILLGTLVIDVDAVEASLGSAPEGQTVGEALTELGDAAISVQGAGLVLHSFVGSAPSQSTSIVIDASGVPIIAYVDPDLEAVRVARCASATDCSTPTISTIFQNLDPFEFLSPSPSGYSLSVALGADGNPVVAYQTLQYYGPGAGPDSTNWVYVFGCGDLNCSTGTVQSVASASSDSSFGQYSSLGGFSLAVGSDGYPLVGYYTSTTTYDPFDPFAPGTTQSWFKLVHCNNAACSSYSTRTLLSQTPTTSSGGASSSIAIGVDGFALASYYHVGVGGLHVSHCSDASCSSWTSSTLDADTGAGTWSSMAIGADNLPIISYSESVGDDLKVAHCVDTPCTIATLSTVDTPGDVGKNNSIAVGSCGLPVISYFDETNDDLRLARCVDADCTNATISVLDSPDSVGRSSDMALDADDSAWVSYLDSTNSQLKLVTSSQGYIWDAICMAKDMASTAQATADALAGGCGGYVAAAVCPIGALDGPKCDAIPVGAFCEGDSECGTSSLLDNCGAYDWYFKIGN